MFTMAIEARYRTVAITLSRHTVSITWTISEEMKCAMGAATQAGADARVCHDDHHWKAHRNTDSRLRVCCERDRPRHGADDECSGSSILGVHAPGCGAVERADAAA